MGPSPAGAAVSKAAFPDRSPPRHRRLMPKMAAARSTSTAGPMMRGADVPWPQAVPTATAFYEGSYTRNNVYCETARLLDDRPAAATRVWAELRTCLDGAESEPQIIELWAVPSGTPRPGFRLRLR